ncbi:MAG: hypothetical protein V5A46_07940 [Haloferacaceae archaeon]
MKTIHSITVTAVVLLFVISAFAGTAAAENDSQDIEADGEKLVPGGGVAYDAPPEDQYLKAKKAFDGNPEDQYLKAKKAFDGNPEDQYLKAKKAFDEDVPEEVFDGDGDEEFQDGSDPVLAP